MSSAPAPRKNEKLLGAQASLPAGFRQELTDRGKQAGMPALPGIFGGVFMSSAPAP
jgi:hypothetical protein